MEEAFPVERDALVNKQDAASAPCSAFCLSSLGKYNGDSHRQASKIHFNVGPPFIMGPSPTTEGGGGGGKVSIRYLFHPLSVRRAREIAWKETVRLMLGGTFKRACCHWPGALEAVPELGGDPKP